MGGFRDAGIQRILNRRLGEVLGGAGVSTMGNTAGTTGTVFGPVALVGLSGVTLSQSTRGNAATISIIASAEAGVAIGAGTQTAQTGTVVFSNSNNVTFGLSNGTLTASAGAGVAVRAGTQTATSGTVNFANSNGITFGMSGSSQITASASAISVVRLQATTGTINFTPNTIIFQDSNGYSFGTSNVGGLPVITINGSAPQISFWDASAAGELAAVSAEVTRMLVQRVNIPNQLAATRAQLMLHLSNSNSAGATHAFSFGVYTMSGSTASLASSASRSWAYNSTLAGSSYTDASGTKYRSMTLGTWNLTPGDYLFALQFRQTTALTSGSYSWIGGHNLSIVGFDFNTAISTDYFNHGKFSVSTAAFPASFAPSDIKGAQFADAQFFPYFQLVGTF